MNRRQALLSLSGMASLAVLPQLTFAADETQPGALLGSGALVGAAWRGPNPGDPHRAGFLEARWDAKTVAIRHAIELPGRAHDVLATPEGGLLVVAFRFGDWMLRCDAKGQVMQRHSLKDEGSRLHCGHAVYAPDHSVLYTSESDVHTNQGWVSVRDPQTFKKLAEFKTHGEDPHQLIVDQAGLLYVTNGGVARDPKTDAKIDLTKMDSSVTRIDPKNGQLLGQWRLDDPRLSIRHVAWNKPSNEPGALLGFALLAEHDSAEQRHAAPVLTVFDGEKLSIPTTLNDGVGYSGNIAAAYQGGFALTSTAGKALVWHPGMPEKLQTIVEMKEAYAIAPWHGPAKGGGALIATALGLVRWHPSVKAQILAWPEPMAVDNHWVLMQES